MVHPIVKDELELLVRVLELLEKLPPENAVSEHSLRSELQGLRELLVSGREHKDQLALESEWTRLTALLRQLHSSRESPHVDRASPYFAHLRLREGDRERELCLGNATCIRDGMRIVDWRSAPISRLFYLYQQGEDYEEEFGGRTVGGTVVARRTVVIRDGRLERIEGPEGIFLRDGDAPGEWRQGERETHRLAGGEGSALRAHPLLAAAAAGSARRLGTDPSGGRRRVDKHLPDIASLIDRPQFELITRPSSGLVAVRGSAGSGKTTVALHRIAYLAHEAPDFDSERTLFLTFSPALRDYVGHVLPALGVPGVRTLTFAGWAAAQRRRLFPDLPGRQRFHTPAAVRRLKLHPALGAALEQHVRQSPGEPTAAQAFDDWASTLTRTALLDEVFEREAPGALSSVNLREATEWCRARNDELYAWLEGERDTSAELDSEDDAILLRAWQLRVGPLPGRGGRPLRYRHIAVDEVQDFSAVEIRVLLEALDSRRSMTLAGDTQQHIAEATGFTSWSEFFRHLGVPEAEVHTLRVSYRSTDQISRFARSILGELAEEDAPPRTVRSGPPVELFPFTDHGACAAFLSDALRELANAEPLASVAVLAPSRAVSDVYFEGLRRSELPRLRQVRNQDFTFAPGIEVTEIEQVKGLEFDYVVLVDVGAASFPASAAARRLLHVGATRAVHQLWVTCAGTPSRLLVVDD